MISVTQEEFENLVNKAVAQLPKIYLDNLKDVAILVEDEPSIEQREKLKLRSDQSLFGLYEGVPLPKRQGSTKLLPDKITLFKRPLEYFSNSAEELFDRIARTIWHEVAHYYGLDHERISELEDKE